jgi:protein-S-isoprenylcysteine O-methyltransferase Ste14
MFVASLALTGWWYVVALGRPGATDASGRAMHVDALLCDVVLVTIFALHHSLFARDAVKRRLSAIPRPLIRSFYVWIASVLLMLVVLLWQPVGGKLYDHHGAAAIPHAAMQLTGLWLIVEAVRRLDPLELAGIRQVIGPRARHETLQMDRAYGLVRHPLYLGWMLVVFGAAQMTGDRLAFAVLTSGYLVVAVPWEERALRQSFGDEYVRYTHRVRWRIVPYIY